MLNLYDAVFKLTNSKLYHSSYKGNIDEVWEVLKNHKFQCQINFLNNLRTLKIENIDIDDIREHGNVTSSAVYMVGKNKIYLPKYNLEMINESFNHELFHVSSSRRNNVSGISIDDEIGQALTEGITEYLNLKSKNKKTSESGYQLELFVIEFLVYIYGEKIIEPYFMNNSKKFFLQFGNFGEDIIKIDSLLKKSVDDYNSVTACLEYLCLTDIAPGILNDNIEFLNHLQIDKKTLRLITFLIDQQMERLQPKVEEYAKEHNIDGFHHIYHSLEKRRIHNKLVKASFNNQIDIFQEILDKLITIAKYEGLSEEDIFKFIMTSYSYKDEQFKGTYGSLIEKMLESQNKKR